MSSTIGPMGADGDGDSVGNEVGLEAADGLGDALAGALSVGATDGEAVAVVGAVVVDDGTVGEAVAGWVTAGVAGVGEEVTVGPDEQAPTINVSASIRTKGRVTCT